MIEMLMRIQMRKAINTGVGPVGLLAETAEERRYSEVILRSTSMPVVSKTFSTSVEASQGRSGDKGRELGLPKR